MKSKRAKRETTPVLLPQMVGNSEVALKLAISTKTLRRWVEKGGFPKPAIMTERIMLWEAAPLAEYLRTGRRPKDPA